MICSNLRSDHLTNKQKMRHINSNKGNRKLLCSYALLSTSVELKQQIKPNERCAGESENEREREKERDRLKEIAVETRK